MKRRHQATRPALLTDCGDLDEALRIRREEELPVYEHLGDASSRALTLGQIADLLSERGELEELRRAKLAPLLVRIDRKANLAEALDHLTWAHRAAVQRQRGGGADRGRLPLTGDPGAGRNVEGGIADVQ